MSITWSYGLRGISTPGDEAHARVLRAIWALSPGARLRDRQVVAGADEIFEIDGSGVFRKLAAGERDEIAAALRGLRGGDLLTWSNELAADFHVDVPPIGVPSFIRRPDGQGFCESRCIALPGSTFDGARAVFVRTQASAVTIDDSSDLLAEHGLTASQAFRLSECALALADLAVDHQLLMTYG